MGLHGPRSRRASRGSGPRTLKPRSRTRRSHGGTPRAAGGSRGGCTELVNSPEYGLLAQVTPEQTIQTLMGKDVEPRFKLIMERAPKIDDVDV